MIFAPFSFPSFPSLRLRPDVASSVDALLGAPRGGAGAGALRQHPGHLLQGLAAQEAAGLPASDDPAAVWGSGSAHPGRLLVEREVLDKVQGQGAGEPGRQGQGPGGSGQGPQGRGVWGLGQGRADRLQGQAGNGAGEHAGSAGEAPSNGDLEAQPGGPSRWACLPCVEQLRWSEGRTGGQSELRVRLLRPTDVLA